MAQANLANEMAILNNKIGTNGITQSIPHYEGDPKQFKEWLKEVEKYAVLVQANQDRTKLIAYQSCRGPVSDFIHRYLTAHPNNTWAQLRTELTNRFSEISDPQHALRLLRDIKQGRHESVQIYSERLLTLAEDAFAGQQGGLAAVERHLISYFVDGLFYEYLQYKCLRDSPQTLQAAITSAVNEQNIRKRFSLRTGREYGRQGTERPSARSEEPMEVDHLRPTRICQLCNLKGHTAKYCRVNKDRTRSKNVNAIDRGESKDSNRVCWACGERGHIRVNCRKKSQSSKNDERKHLN
ncbi:uncharacterized protein LOC132733112 [Ruditapes philippinarum]|uniref:uncharacterized protein LOC132733112 n=1 Tax=Ruditapes philippinarum TaxID=129788 RepID=UPI00295BEEE7|nr:uncharacterized protein LOC132733112 [Ruditapes philippinarum]